MTGKAMQLLCSKPSAFSRKVRLAAAALDLTDQIAIVSTQPEPDLERILPLNPLGKIPVLIDGEFTCYDSPLICRYLDETYGPGTIIPVDPPRRYAALRREALADGLIEAGMAYRAERMRPDGGLARVADSQRGRIIAALARLEEQIADSWTVGEMAMVSAIGWLEFRLAEEGFLAACPGLSDWYRQAAARPEVQATRPDL